MIGNDVVDLKLAKIESNWKRNGYLNKIFTDVEQSFILKSSIPDKAVWSLWTRKEAVYKILLQQGFEKGFYTKKIECLDEENACGTVVFNSKTYYTKTIISDNYIHSIAVVNDLNLQKVVAVIWDENCFTTNRIPYQIELNIIHNISKSHHGRFEKIVKLS